MKIKKKRFKINFQKATFIIITFSFVIFFFVAKKPVSVESQILEKVKKFPEVQNYKNYPANVTFLTKGEVKELAKNYPVIYGNITRDVYEIRFFSDSRSLLVLYDIEENIIIRAFEIMGIRI